MLDAQGCTSTCLLSGKINTELALKYVQFQPTGWMPTSSVFLGVWYHRCDRPFYCHPTQNSLVEINREHDPILLLRLSKGLCLRIWGCVTAERSWSSAKWCGLSKLWTMFNGSQQKWCSRSLSHNMEKGWYYNERKRQNSICVPKMLRSMFKHTGTHTRKNMGGNIPKH